MAAAVLAVGPGAVLSHRSAAALHGIRESDGAVDVTTTRRASTRGVVVHCVARLHASDVTARGAIPVTTLPRTLLDLAAILTPEQLGKLLRETDRLGRLDVAARSPSTNASLRPSPSPSSRTASWLSSMPRACPGH
jgi:predicted transcriptional regulator of viral defense system